MTTDGISVQSMIIECDSILTVSADPGGYTITLAVRTAGKTSYATTHVIMTPEDARMLADLLIQQANCLDLSSS